MRGCQHRGIEVRRGHQYRGMGPLRAHLRNACSIPRTIQFSDMHTVWRNVSKLKQSTASYYQGDILILKSIYRKVYEFLHSIAIYIVCWLYIIKHCVLLVWFKFKNIRKSFRESSCYFSDFNPSDILMANTLKNLK